MTRRRPRVVMGEGNSWTATADRVVRSAVVFLRRDIAKRDRGRLQCAWFDFNTACMSGPKHWRTPMATQDELTRDEFVARMAEYDEANGKPADPEHYAELWRLFELGKARTEAIESAGLALTWRKHLLRIENARYAYRGGASGKELIDGKLVYQHQVTISGATYPIRDALKAMGFRWDRADKLWWRPMTDGATIADNVDVATDELLEALER